MAQIFKWRGLLGNESRRTRNLVFVTLAVLAFGMTLTQLGFVAVRTYNDTYYYILGFLLPITLCALLLGKNYGALLGLVSDAALLLHSQIMPLDLYEWYYVGTLKTFQLFALTGYLIGLVFALALHARPKRPALQILVASAVVSALASAAFVLTASASYRIADARGLLVSTGAVTDSLGHDLLVDICSTGSLSMQLLTDFGIVFVASFVCASFVGWYQSVSTYVGVRRVFSMRLLSAVVVVFVLVQALSYASISYGTLWSASEEMGGEVDFIADQIDPYIDYVDKLFNMAWVHEAEDEELRELAAFDPAESLIDGYDLDDGTVLVFADDTVYYTDNPAFPSQSKLTDYFGPYVEELFDSLAQEDSMSAIYYSTVARDADGDTIEDYNVLSGEIGFIRVTNRDEFSVMMARPASMIFEGRGSVIGWATLLALALTAAAYVAAMRVLTKVVVEPIDRTNASLAKIMGGDLDELVCEVGTVEFASFSAGINSTVDALKVLINESERRMEHDLQTAKTIQESALPRTFPPFPEIDAFDLFASMNAAKSVGGDFYDFFLVDDHTLAFLIADVSGKGIPGALFMMAAKTEIGNYLSTGMPPAEAIASANRHLCDGNEADMFVTVWAATLDFETGLVTYVNAGHNFPLLRHGTNGTWEWLKKRCGLFLGTFETAKYRQETLTLEVGDQLLLYTDGVNEAFSADGEEYGNDRLEAFLNSHAYLGPKLLVNRLRADVAIWADGAEQSDDITILALEYGTSSEAADTLTVTATLEAMEEVAAFVNEELDRRLCPVSVQHKVEVALEELFVNVCRYAYAERDVPGEVSVSYVYSEDPRQIVVTLRDEGIPFDPVTRQDPTKPKTIHETKIGGLGIYMVKRTMDDLTYDYDGTSNIVSFRKGW